MSSIFVTTQKSPEIKLLLKCFPTLMDNFNQEIRKFKNILQLYLNLTRQIEEKKKTF